jgi:hypothetical protein
MTSGRFPSTGDDPMAFEQEVRRVAGLLYPDVYGGPTVVQGSERDGIFITEDTVVLLEATLSRDKAKAEKDGRKLKALSDRLARQYPFHAIKAFFVTRAEPTADQVDVIRKIGQPVVAISYVKFRARLIDSAAYLNARSDHAFGSARDPETNDVRLRDSYVTLDFVDAIDRRTQYNVRAIINAIDAGRRVVLLGDYGAGKSMTLRQVYLDFAKRHRKDGTAQFCLHLNLNEHQGQMEPAEALIRHAGLIGFPQPHQLVRAWKSGDAHIILDGFDEVFVPGWATASRSLAEIRRRSVALIRQFVTETPSTSGLLIAGREHFFDRISELKSALAITSGALIASATDFTEEQVEQYLRQREWKAALPDWLPRRPLIVGYLAGRKLFEVIDELSVSDPGVGWHRLIAALSAREARIDAGIDEDTVREIIERLSTLARKTSGGLGPLSFEDLVTVFRDLRGYLPDEGAYSVLQRLPGLRVNDNQINSRLFVDDALVDACRAGDVYRWVKHPEEKRVVEAMYGWQNLLGNVGLAVLKCRLDEEGLTHRLVQTALERAHGRSELDGLRADLVRSLFLMGSSSQKMLTISDQHIPTLYLSEASDASNVTFSECIIETLDLSDVETAERLPILKDCSVALVEGVTGLDELAAGKFTGSELIRFSESAENVAAILRLDLPDYTRVALTVLRKIFVQSGHSRKESALYRGLLTNKQKELIPLVLASLEKQGAIRKNRRRDATLWAPNLGMYRRVTRILDAPTTSRDELVFVQD